MFQLQKSKRAIYQKKKLDFQIMAEGGFGSFDDLFFFLDAMIAAFVSSEKNVYETMDATYSIDCKYPFLELILNNTPSFHSSEAIPT